LGHDWRAYYRSSSTRKAQHFGSCGALPLRAGLGHGDRMPGAIEQITVESLSGWLAQKRAVLLVDVRERWEHTTAALPQSLLLPMSEMGDAEETRSQLQEAIAARAPGDLTVVAYCHHGVRSLNAAAYFQSLGFEGVISLAGGIDAWSLRIDPTVPRY